MEAIAKQEPAIQKAIEIESLFTQDDVLRLEYEQRKNAIMDYTSAMDAAQRIGIEYGIKQGIEQGIQQGIERGIEKGQKEAARSTAIKLLNKGYSVESIEEITDLTLQEIAILRNSLS